MEEEEQKIVIQQRLIDCFHSVIASPHAAGEGGG